MNANDLLLAAETARTKEAAYKSGFDEGYRQGVRDAIAQARKIVDEHFDKSAAALGFAPKEGT